jgi:hypothetical protein
MHATAIGHKFLTVLLGWGSAIPDHRDHPSGTSRQRYALSHQGQIESGNALSENLLRHTCSIFGDSKHSGSTL